MKYHVICIFFSTGELSLCPYTQLGTENSSQTFLHSCPDANCTTRIQHDAAREKELRYLRKSLVITAANLMVMAIIPIIFTFCMLMVHAVLGNQLTVGACPLSLTVAAQSNWQALTPRSQHFYSETETPLCTHKMRRILCMCSSHAGIRGISCHRASGDAAKSFDENSRGAFLHRCCG